MKLSRYIRKIRGVSCMLLINLLTFYAIFYLTHLDMLYYHIGLIISLSIYAVYCFSEIFLVNNELEKEEKIEQLQKEIYQLEQTRIQERQDLMDYFFVWVHQIKTPITAAKLIVDTEEIDCSNQLKEQLFAIDNYTEMALNYLKLFQTSADMSFTQCDLEAIVKSIVKRYSILFFNRKNSIEFENLNHTVLSDPKWLSILIEQLISNAVKYTQNGIIKIAYDEKTKTLSVIDNGCGIKKEDQKRIFEKGYSGFNGQYNEKSSGIGLFLVQQISHKLELAVDFESTYQEGSTFYIHFDKNYLTTL